MAVSDIEDDASDMWRSYKAQRRQKRHDNLSSSIGILKSRGVMLVSANDYIHTQIRDDRFFIDYWPSTGKWVARKPESKEGRGFQSLLKFLDEHCYSYNLPKAQPSDRPQVKPQSAIKKLPVLLGGNGNNDSKGDVVSSDDSTPPWD